MPAWANMHALPTGDRSSSCSRLAGWRGHSVRTMMSRSRGSTSATSRRTSTSSAGAAAHGQGDGQRACLSKAGYSRLRHAEASGPLVHGSLLLRAPPLPVMRAPLHMQLPFLGMKTSPLMCCMRSGALVQELPGADCRWFAFACSPALSSPIDWVLAASHRRRCGGEWSGDDTGPAGPAVVSRGGALPEALQLQAGTRLARITLPASSRWHGCMQLLLQEPLPAGCAWERLTHTCGDGCRPHRSAAPPVARTGSAAGGWAAAGHHAQHLSDLQGHRRRVLHQPGRRCACFVCASTCMAVGEGHGAALHSCLS